MSKGYHHLTYSERSQIFILKDSGHSIRKISKELKVAPSTICREFSRNTPQEKYSTEQA
jgi:IS30 family transposase